VRGDPRRIDALPTRVPEKGWPTFPRPVSEATLVELMQSELAFRGKGRAAVSASAVRGDPRRIDAVPTRVPEKGLGLRFRVRCARRHSSKRASARQGAQVDLRSPAVTQTSPDASACGYREVSLREQRRHHSVSARCRAGSRRRTPVDVSRSDRRNASCNAGCVLRKRSSIHDQVAFREAAEDDALE
jgi:hypothetical protein